MWIECVRIHLPRSRPAAADPRREDDLRESSRRRAARSRPADDPHAATESLAAAIHAGLLARGLLVPIEGPAERGRRRVGYVVRDALDELRREGRPLPT